MDIAINQTILACPDYPDAASNIPKLYDPEKFSDPSRLAEIVCEAARLPNLWPYLISTYYRKICLIGGIIGMISAILALIAYSLKEFHATAFQYYRAINLFDFVYNAYFVLFGASVTSLAQSTEDHFGVEAFLYAIRAAAKSAHILVLWTAFDRAVACSWPTKYYLLDRKRVAILVIVSICAFALIYDIPFTYYDIQVKYFNGTSPQLPLAVTERVLRAYEGGLMLIFMIVVVVGLVRMTKRKRKLLGAGNEGVADRGLLDQIKVNQSLCLLQLCEGVPFVMTTVAIYLSYLNNFLMYYRESADPLLPGGTYEENVTYQRMYMFQRYIVTFLVSATDIYSHSFHFYNYMAFSPRFRRTVVSFVKGRWGLAVTATVAPQA